MALTCFFDWLGERKFEDCEAIYLTSSHDEPSARIEDKFNPLRSGDFS